MNANSSPLAPPTLHKWLTESTKALKVAGIGTARLDMLVLLADELRRDKAWLLAHGEQKLTVKQVQRLNQKLERRSKREPLAYIRGHQEFYGRRFAVDARVLIPRPETEVLVEELLKLPIHAGDTLLDVGTGSGAIAITVKLERPELQVAAIDVDTRALKVAQKNARQLGADILFTQSNLLDDAPPARFIAANLPYVDQTWQRSPETVFEPTLALFADDYGLGLIKKLITQTPSKLAQHGYLLLEVDPRQHADIIAFARSHALQLQTVRDYVLVLRN